LQLTGVAIAEVFVNDEKLTIKTVTLAYFSGTGGTEKIVRCFEQESITALQGLVSTVYGV